ncbi:MAG: hypothetical protein PVI40_01645 [Chlamydiota bacterium]|jgi:hypothetical protein
MGLEERKKGQAPRKPRDFQDELEEAILRFKAAFELLQQTSLASDSEHLLDVMYKELNLMDKLATAIERKGIRKWEQKLSKDAQTFISKQNRENFEVLQQDIATLSEANRRPRK